MVCPSLLLQTTADGAMKLKWLRANRSRKERASSDSRSRDDSTTTGSVTKATSILDLYRDKKGKTSKRLSEDKASQPRELSPRSSYHDLDSLPHPELSTLGLRVIHDPVQTAPLDIIFVHGLGGNSQKTWSKNHDSRLFWPKLWLPFEPEIGKARILTFGYNANFNVGSPGSISNIGDFAKELLFEMKFGKTKEAEDLAIGKVPIIFIVHSMGGLVVKRAYILGQNDDEYKQIIRSVSAIMFMATPHRGSKLAEILTRILAASLQSPKSFINDLKKGSSALEDLNEQFRHIAPKISIVSFYETLATKVGPRKLMILEKDSSVLGYPGEVSKALNADHHDVVKYSSPSDPNYVSVRNMIKTLVERFKSKGSNATNSHNIEDAKDIKQLLGTLPSEEDEFKAIRKRWMPGTCDWLLEEPQIHEWLETDSASRIVWYSAAPASGKSTLAAHLISHLRSTNKLCLFFFFKYGDHAKHNLSTMLLSLASQLARDVPAFRRVLLELSSEGLKLDRAHYSLIWQRIFESILFEMELEDPIHIVIDALDECESAKALLDLLQTVPNSQVVLRVLIISRKTESLSLIFKRLSEFVPVDSIAKDKHGHNAVDIETLVDTEIKHIRGSDEIKDRVKQNIVDRAAGNFLWVRLIMQEILDCHSEEGIQETLAQIPDNMNKFYERMELSIMNEPKETTRRLAKTLLQWTICSHHSLSLKELSQALRPEFPEFLDLKRTIQDVCGHFISVDHNGYVAMVHQTAREYLVQSSGKLYIDVKEGHGHLFRKAISTLLDPTLRSKLTQSRYTLSASDPFISYAAVSWVYHLRERGEFLHEDLKMLLKLFGSTSVLVWIHAVALTGQFEVLIQVAKVLTKFTSTYRMLHKDEPQAGNHVFDLEPLDNWIVDLVKVVGKFSRHLRSEPSAIYKIVPAFCPQESVLHRQFYNSDSANVLVSGVSNIAWNSNLAKINVPTADQAWDITCGGQHIAVSTSTGSVQVWNSDNFTEVCTLRHGEPILAMCFNKKGTQMVSYGLRSSKLWAVPSGKLLSVATNPVDVKAMAIMFSENGTKIIAGGNDRVIRYLQTNNFDSGWHEIDRDLPRESWLEGTIVSSPTCMAFSEDAGQVGIAYRGYPLSVWTLKEGTCLGVCRRVKGIRSISECPSNTWTAVHRFTFNPVSGHIIGAYKDGCVFKWHPITDDYEEVQSTADEVAASADGRLFITSSNDGTIRVWDFASFGVTYQLSSSDLITSLAFSPDCTRFYDVRGSSVNAWESNSFDHLSENEASFSNAHSEAPSPELIAHASKALIVEYEAASAVAASPGGSLYCFGNEEGCVQLLDAQTGEAIELAKFFNFLSVRHLVWGKETHLAAADLGGDIIVKRLPPRKTSSLRSYVFETLPSPKPNLEGNAIHQMLFNDDADQLLIVSNDTCQVWVVEDGAMKCFTVIEQGIARRWLNHPTEKHLFMGCGPCDIRIFQWHNLFELHILEFREAQPRRKDTKSYDLYEQPGVAELSLSTESTDAHGVISSTNKAIATQDGKHIMVQIKDRSPQGRTTQRLLIFDKLSFDLDICAKNNHTLTYSYIPPEILARVDVPLDIIFGSRLVFLDQDLWLCTYRLKSSHDDEVARRCYFIPRDWISTDGLDQCCLMRDQTLLCPVADKVAVIKSSLEFGGF
ncbi:NACHT and WD domain-containing protein [Phlyctema vagabunda]|uniref:NACHT and WD domain-containing protein n=1 Tax=Phlyctema vagabunda TaxID=108571 RepID=A0ABR4P8L0_9HELO